MLSFKVSGRLINKNTGQGITGFYIFNNDQNPSMTGSEGEFTINFNAPTDGDIIVQGPWKKFTHELQNAIDLRSVTGDIRGMDITLDLRSVRGRIVNTGSSNVKFSEILVSAFDKSPGLNTELGMAEVMEKDGSYCVYYDGSSLPKGKSDTDLFVKLGKLEGKLGMVYFQTSPLFLNAFKDEYINFVLGDEAPKSEFTEYRILDNALGRYLGEDQLSNISVEDVFVIANREKLNPEIVALFVKSKKSGLEMQETTGFLLDDCAKVLYGLFRQKMPTDIIELTKFRKEELVSKLSESVTQNIITDSDASFLFSGSDFIDSLTETVSHKMVEKTCDLDRILQSVIHATPSQTETSAYWDRAELIWWYLSEHMTSGDENLFWERLGQGTYKDKVPNLKKAFKYASFVGANTPLIKRLLGSAEVDKPESLLEKDRTWWENFVANDYPGFKLTVDSGERNKLKSIYVEYIIKKVKVSFPNDDFLRQVKTEDSFANIKIAFNSDLQEIGCHFDFLKSDINRYKSDIKKAYGEHPQLVYNPESDEGKAIFANLAKVQRLFRIAPPSKRYDFVNEMVSLGYESATQIACGGKNNFKKRCMGKFSDEEINNTFEQASKIHTTTLLKFTSGGKIANDVTAHNVMKSQEMINSEDGLTYENIFGSVDSYDCDHDDSVFGPAAYLVDMLKYLGEDEDDNLIEKLSTRRPDIFKTELSSKNTSTPLPYIDLVNEILENAVVREASIEAGNGEPGPEAYQNQTTKDAGDLKARPEHTNVAAYEKLANTVYPQNFNLWKEEIEAYMAQLDVGEEDLVTVLDLSGGSEKQLCKIGLKLSDNEWNLVTFNSPLSDYYGKGVDVDDLRKLSILLKRAMISYEDLLQLLETNYITANKSDISYPEGPSLSDAVINITEKDLVKLRIFHLLRTRLGWSTYDLDRAITALGGNIDASFLHKLMYLKLLRKRFCDISFGELLSWISEIETCNYEDSPSFFDTLFLSHIEENDKDMFTALRDDTNTYSFDAKGETISKAFEVKYETLLYICKELGCSSISKKTINLVWRVVSMCRYLSISAKDFFFYDKEFLNTSLYLEKINPKELIEKLKKLEILLRTGVSVEEISKILYGEAVSYRLNESKVENKVALLQEITDEINKIKESDAAGIEEVEKYLISKFSTVTNISSEVAGIVVTKTLLQSKAIWENFLDYTNVTLIHGKLDMTLRVCNLIEKLGLTKPEDVDVILEEELFSHSLDKHSDYCLSFEKNGYAEILLSNAVQFNESFDPEKGVSIAFLINPEQKLLGNTTDIFSIQFFDPTSYKIHIDANITNDGKLAINYQDSNQNWELLSGSSLARDHWNLCVVNLSCYKQEIFVNNMENPTSKRSGEIAPISRLYYGIYLSDSLGQSYSITNFALTKGIVDLHGRKNFQDTLEIENAVLNLPFNGNINDVSGYGSEVKLHGGCWNKKHLVLNDYLKGYGKADRSITHWEAAENVELLDPATDEICLKIEPGNSSFAKGFGVGCNRKYRMKGYVKVDSTQISPIIRTGQKELIQIDCAIIDEWQEIDVTFVSENYHIDFGGTVSSTATKPYYVGYKNITIEEYLPYYDNKCNEVKNLFTCNPEGFEKATNTQIEYLSKSSGEKNGFKMKATPSSSSVTLDASQKILTKGKFYRLRGSVRSNGSEKKGYLTPFIRGCGHGEWRGKKDSGEWQNFDFLFKAINNTISIKANIYKPDAEDERYIEVQNISVEEINPEIFYSSSLIEEGVIPEKNLYSAYENHATLSKIDKDGRYSFLLNNYEGYIKVPVDLTTGKKYYCRMRVINDSMPKSVDVGCNHMFDEKALEAYEKATLSFVLSRDYKDIPIVLGARPLNGGNNPKGSAFTIDSIEFVELDLEKKDRLNFVSTVSEIVIPSLGDIGSDIFFSLIEKKKFQNNYLPENFSIFDLSEEVKDIDTLCEKLTWAEDIKEFIKKECTKLDLSDYTDFKIVYALIDVSKKIGINPMSLYDFLSGQNYRETAEIIKSNFKKKYSHNEWKEVVISINDKLREKRRDALENYLIVNGITVSSNHSKKWEIANRDDLFEHYLIDTQMCSMSMTSRIKQAISATQLFIQRILLNLEKHYINGHWVELTVDKNWAEEWKWRKNYRVWEANRKIFLYPENWIEPELRDDKTVFFKDFESELLQSEVNADAAERIYVSYLEKLNEVANLEICGMCEHEEENSIYLFARTRNYPHVYYWRKYVGKSYWTGWEKIELNIEGDHLIPIVANRRIYLFWAKFIKRSEEVKTENLTTKTDGTKVSGSLPSKAADIKICWSEYRNSKWAEAKISRESIKTDEIKKNDLFKALSPDKSDPENIEAMEDFLAKELPEEGFRFAASLDVDANLRIRSFFTYPGYDLSLEGPEFSVNYYTGAIDKISDDSWKMSYYYRLPMGCEHSYMKIRNTNTKTTALTFFKNDKILAKPPHHFMLTPLYNNGKVGSHEFFYEDRDHTFFSDFSIIRERVEENDGPYIPPVDDDRVDKNIFKIDHWHLHETALTEHMVNELAKENIGPDSVINEGFYHHATLWGDKTQTFSTSDKFAPNIHADNSNQFYFGKDSGKTVIVDRAQLFGDIGQKNTIGLVNGLQNNVTVTTSMAAPQATTMMRLFRPPEIGTVHTIQPVQSVHSFPPELKLANTLQVIKKNTFDRKEIPIPVSSNIAVDEILYDNQYRTRSYYDTTASGFTDNRNPYLGSSKTKYLDKNIYKFYSFQHPVVPLFIREVNKRGVEGLLDPTVKDLKLQSYSKEYFEDKYEPHYKYVDTDYPKMEIDFDSKSGYGLYNWELFFHAPFMVAKKLFQNQRFEEAQKWFHYLFNPTESEGAAPHRFWKIKPFAEAEVHTLQDLSEKLNSGNRELMNLVNLWESDPFKPHLIARLRISAYMKAVVMAYIDNLVAWADNLFRRDTAEAINEATQLYVLAAQILGRKPVEIAKENRDVKSFEEFKKLGLFSNAMCETETSVSMDQSRRVLLSNELNTRANSSGKTGIDTLSSIINIRETSDKKYELYFGIPKNEKLLRYWDIVADRLFKIRHCMNIDGVVRQLPLFAPPIDPGMLVKAAAAGVDIGSAISDMFAPLPNYRFSHVFQKAKELCDDVKSFGSALLSALEKKDAEKIALLRSSHEMKMQELLTDIKKKQIEEAEKALEGLMESKKVNQFKHQYYSSRKRMITREENHLEHMRKSNNYQVQAQSTEKLASIFAMLPDIDAGAHGAGGSPKVSFAFGGSLLSKIASLSAKSFSIKSTKESYKASRASTLAGYDRRAEDWKFQADMAKKELEQIEKQILGAQIRIAVTKNELKNHEHQIKHTKEMDEMMREKFTNQDLYEWMTTQLSGLYFQSYQMAYDIAKKAEKCYQFELGLQNSNFIQFGYWDSLKKGLLAGEKLCNDLRRLDISYMEKNKREFEITKQVSLAQINPKALVDLRIDGECNFDIPEVVYDLDYPGQYKRRIKSVAITIPCVTGPYTNVGAKLTLISDKTRLEPFENSSFIEKWVSNHAIATSSAQNDSGMFELNFRDERYLPFEGAGAISSWNLVLPKELRQFDYNTISDVVIHVNYTAKEDGNFRDSVEQRIKDALNSIVKDTKGMILGMSMKKKFPDQLHMLNETKACSFKVERKDFPHFLQERDLTGDTPAYKVKIQSAGDCRWYVPNLTGKDSAKVSCGSVFDKDVFTVTVDYERGEGSEDLKDLIIHLPFKVS